MRKVVLIGLVLFFVTGFGCIEQTDNASEKTQKVYGIDDKIIIGEGGYEKEIVVHKGIVREVSVDTGEAKEYNVMGFGYYIPKTQGHKGEFLYLKVEVEGIGYKAQNLPAPKLILTDIYGEEIYKKGVYTSLNHSNYYGSIPIEYNKKSELLGEYSLIEHTEFIQSARLQIETENELISIPFNITELIKYKRPVDYFELPPYCYLLGPSWEADGVYLDLKGKLNSMEENKMTPDDVYKFITECLQPLSYNIDMKGNFPNGDLCYKGNCSKMYQYEKYNIEVPEIIKNEQDFILAKNSFCNDLRYLIPSATSQIILGDHKVTINS